MAGHVQNSTKIPNAKKALNTKQIMFCGLRGAIVQQLPVENKSFFNKI